MGKKKTIRISRDLLKLILEEVHEDLWDYWKEYSPKIYQQLKKIEEKDKKKD